MPSHPPDTMLDTILNVAAHHIADTQATMSSIRASHSLDTATTPSKPTAEAIEDIRAGLAAKLDKYIGSGVLDSPFSDIRVIHQETGDCFDVEGAYLLTLAQSGIEDIFRLSANVQVHSSDGRILREKNRYNR